MSFLLSSERRVARCDKAEAKKFCGGLTPADYAFGVTAYYTKIMGLASTKRIVAAGNFSRSAKKFGRD